MAGLAADLHAELAFSDSPYHRTIPPGSLSAAELAADQTALVERGELPPPNFSANGVNGSAPTPPSLGSPNAPTTRPPTEPTSPPAGRPSAEPVTTGMPASLNRPYPADTSASDSQTRNTLILGAFVLLALVVILVVVFGVKSVWDSSQAQSARDDAQVLYDDGKRAEGQGQRAIASEDYVQALQKAPPSSDVARKAEQALKDLGPGSGPAPGDGGGSPPPADTNEATRDYNLGVLYQRNNNEDAALLEFAAAAKADPNGDIGVKARAEAARGYTEAADRAFQAGDIPSARKSWQSVIDISPSDPLADQARQHLQQYPTDSTSPSAPVQSTSSPATGAAPPPGSAASPAPAGSAPANGPSTPPGNAPPPPPPSKL